MHAGSFLFDAASYGNTCVSVQPCFEKEMMYNNLVLSLWEEIVCCHL
jgi:hypothetical protein